MHGQLWQNHARTKRLTQNERIGDLSELLSDTTGLPRRAQNRSAAQASQAATVGREELGA